MTRQQGRLALVMLLVLTLSACAADANAAVGTGAQSGFWPGLWHGAISPVTFVVSLFDADVAIYEVHNSGHWYDFGFVLGASVAFSGAARSAGSARSARSPAARRGRTSTP